MALPSGSAEFMTSRDPEPLTRRFASPGARLALFAVAGVVLRSPAFFHYSLDWDEGAILSEAWAMSTGLALYRDVFQIHPPLQFLLFLPFFELLPVTAVPLAGKILVTACGVLTSWLVGEIATRLTGDHVVGILTGAMALRHLASWFMAPYGEFLALLPMTLAIWALFVSRPGIVHEIAAGAYLAAAVSFKQPVVVDAVILAAGYLFLCRSGARRRTRSLGALAAGAMVPILMQLWYLWAAGSLPQALHYLGPGVARYTRASGGASLRVLAVALDVFKLELLAIFPALIAAAAGARASGSIRTRTPLVVSLGASLMTLTVLFMIGSRFYPHYLIQMVVAIAILASVAVRRVKAPTRRVLVLWLLIATGWLGGLDLARGIWRLIREEGRPLSVRRTEELAAYIRASSATDDTMFAYGLCELDVFYLAQRRSNNGVYMFVDMFAAHIGDAAFETAKRREFLDSLPNVILFDPHGCLADAFPSARAFVESAIACCYVRTNVIRGVEVYRKRPVPNRDEKPRTGPSTSGPG